MLRNRKVIHLIKNLNWDSDFVHLFTSLEICNSGYYEHVDLSDNSNKSQVEKNVTQFIRTEGRQIRKRIIRQKLKKNISECEQ